MANYTCCVCGKPCGADYRIVGHVIDGWPHELPRIQSASFPETRAHELPRNVAVHRACAPQLASTEFGRQLAALAMPVRPALH